MITTRHRSPSSRPLHMAAARTRRVLASREGPASRLRMTAAPTRHIRVIAALLIAVAFTATACADGTGDRAEGTSNPVDSTSTRAEGTSDRADSTVYVNLGDSYSAGTGVRPLVEDSPFQCQRSSLNFAHVLAQRRGLALDDVSCAGATTSDFFAAQYFGVGPQLDALGDGTRFVTLMIGGNDGDIFSGTIRDCGDVAAENPSGSPCRARYGDTFVERVRERTYPDVVRALRAVGERAPHARVLVVGYPWILPPTTGCYPTMRVAAGDVAYIRDLQSTLNDTVARATAATGGTFVDMSAVSEGHDACQPEGTRWIEPQVGSSAPVTVHPNAAGQRAIADEVGAALAR
ncbi:SGNH/GDSL hydrolase family protein [Gordonia otitidis]|uniref:Esterase n=1 Tax=Gordonia otitidis (strain DSM 44809 / CCUG 52243 / JCM 12355 / NBRC 100426 / IFM 10032) TaxID=1108044 RepID=H5TI42_GORO1|nr:SGNH/GDSL hydrolase family protein [Gordonia otitidis]GAB33150.1 putative esterase [Gordonia otitidis NBRC 100426]